MLPILFFRNLFFRTIYLLLADINPIFVLEGDAPDLKRDVMAARNAIQFRGAAPRSDAAVKNKRPDVARKRFRNVLKEVGFSTVLDYFLLFLTHITFGNMFLF